jgi:ATP-dependent helicase/nuclease subunit A
MLPNLPPAARLRAGARLLAAEGGALPESERKELLDATIDILNTPDFAEMLGPDSRAEVAITVETRGADGRPVLVSGQIDRLLIREKDVLILDYKSGAKIPARPEWIAHGFVAQLAAYRAALKRMFPDKTVRAALLWTEGPLLMDVPAPVLDAAEQLSFLGKDGGRERLIA